MSASLTERGRLGPRLRLADIVELGLVARTAEGAGEDLHGRPSGGLVARVLDRLQDLEALKLGVAEIKRLVGARAAVRGAKMFGLGPGGEGVLARPDGVRRIEHVIVALGPAQQVELDEARARGRDGYRARATPVRTRFRRPS